MYYFQVVAFNVIGDSLPSTAQYVIAANYPEQPLAPTMISQSPNEIVVKWTMPNSGGIPITSYTLWWKEASQSTYSILKKDSALIRQFTCSTVVPGKTYDFKVMATNVVGDSALSPFLAITAAQKPDAPLVPVLVDQDPTFIKFLWSVPNDQYSPI